MTTSPPSVPPSFDPAIHLHSEGVNDLPEPPSEPFSDELEVLHLQRAENLRNKVVIQHRAWNLSDVFRSDEDIRPGTRIGDAEEGAANVLTLKQIRLQSPASNSSSITSPPPVGRWSSCPLRRQSQECRSFLLQWPSRPVRHRQSLRSARMTPNPRTRNPNARR